MESRIIETPVDKAEYPCLKKHCNLKFIVLFIDKTKGTVVYSNNDDFTVGEYSNNWSDRYKRIDSNIIVQLQND